MKIRTTNIASERHHRLFTKLCTPENNPLYGMRTIRYSSTEASSHEDDCTHTVQLTDGLTVLCYLSHEAPTNIIGNTDSHTLEWYVDRVEIPLISGSGRRSISLTFSIHFNGNSQLKAPKRDVSSLNFIAACLKRLQCQHNHIYSGDVDNMRWTLNKLCLCIFWLARCVYNVLVDTLFVCLHAAALSRCTCTI